MKLSQTPRFLILLSALLLGACGGGSSDTGTEPATTQLPSADAGTAGARLQASTEGYSLASPEVPVSAYQKTRWKAFLVAGNTLEPVFDNFVLSLSTWLGAHDVAPVELLLAKSSDLTHLSSSENILATLVRGAPGPGEGCFIYMTSHGSADTATEKGGLWLAPAGLKSETLTPAMLNGMLANACGARPTVVVLSGCYSGVYMSEGIAAPNRVVLTASRADRTSFGCEAEADYTFFDKCFLQSLDSSSTLQDLSGTIRACVTKRESELGYTRSEPQAFFGRDMRDLDLPNAAASQAAAQAAL